MESWSKQLVREKKEKKRRCAKSRKAKRCRNASR